MRSIEERNAEALEHSQAAVPLWVIAYWVDQGPVHNEDSWHLTCECGLEYRSLRDGEWEDPHSHGERCTWAVAARVLRDQLRD